MSYFKHKQWLKVAVGVLLLLNIATLAWMALGTPHRPPRQAPSERLVKDLGFDDKQTQAFNTELNALHEEIQSIERQLREAKKAFFSNLKKEIVADSLIEAGAQHIGALEAKRDLITYRHLKKVQDICNPQQKAKFNDLVLDALRPPGPPPPRH